MSKNDLIILDQVIEQQHKAQAPGLSPSRFFELFVAEQVLKDLDLSYDELEGGIVGDGGDGGIDSMYIFANGEFVPEDFDVSNLKKGILLDVYIIQAKRSEGFQETPIEKFISASEDLFDLSKQLDTLKSIYNSSVLTIAATFLKCIKQHFLTQLLEKGDLDVVRRGLDLSD